MKRITQDELIPYILRVLCEYGECGATREEIENKIYHLPENLFIDDYEWFHHGTPGAKGISRWKQHIAWALTRAKDKYGYVDNPQRGIWRLSNRHSAT